MASESSPSRPLLPQSTQSQMFPYAAPTSAPREAQQRNYVFVDEHNRHKRLKVMRACEGCRRRKIKCDAATTNTWPCAACTRLKLTCVPPTVSYERESDSPGVSTFEIQGNPDFASSSGSSPSDYRGHSIPQQAYTVLGQVVPGSDASSYAEVPIYQSPSFITSVTAQEVLPYASMVATTLPAQELKLSGFYSSPQSSSARSITSNPGWSSDGGFPRLLEALGELKIDPMATAPYITDQKKFADSPAVEELEMKLPITLGPDMRVRIPPEMMPSEHQAMQYFDYFFNNIHPFCPVLEREAFLHQWSTDRESISPLLLEAIFAITTGMLENHPEGNKWLALASKHEESFKDVPRMSTLQAMCIMLKARETSPKRGYFYRSWMVLVTMIATAKDLELDQHLDQHIGGRSCGESTIDCLLKTRIWQLLFILEIMIGGPQGRVNYSIQIDSVDFDHPQARNGITDSEYQTSRQFTYFAQLVKPIRSDLDAYSRLRRVKADWSLDPAFAASEIEHERWIKGLPSDMQILFPADGSMPWIPSPFLGHVHCYHYLSVMMHHRPQIHYLMENSTGDSWKRYMMDCLEASRKMCRIQESIVRSYGFAGLMCMQRGLSFTIYCILTCTMLHLASITSPDPDLNSDAREFFVRHMRTLEELTPSWPMLDMRIQIDALRTAFSADTSKPFELKPNFPFGSPPTVHATPISTNETYSSASSNQDIALESTGQVNYRIMNPITPPVSTTDEETKTDSPAEQSLSMIANQNRVSQARAQASVQGHWNPTRLFDQWNIAFNAPQDLPQLATGSHQSPSSSSGPPLDEYDLRPHMAKLPQNFSSASGFATGERGQPQIPGSVAPPNSYGTGNIEYISPSMWQDAVASSFGDGLKRSWDYSANANQMNKRQR